MPRVIRNGNTMHQGINILLIDDQPRSREQIGRTLASEPAFVHAHAAATVREGMEVLQSCRMALVLIGLDSQDKLDVLRSIKASHPGARCIVLSDSNRTEDLLDALKAGADGYLLKSTPPAAMCAKLMKALSGITVVQEDLKQALVDSIIQKQRIAEEAQLEVALTRREREILDCMTRQLDTRTIAQTLGISVSTVKTHINHLLAKLNLSKRPDASAWAGLLSRTRFISLPA